MIGWKFDLIYMKDSYILTNERFNTNNYLIKYRVKLDSLTNYIPFFYFYSSNTETNKYLSIVVPNCKHNCLRCDIDNME